jgi:hypothetical protein
MDEFNFKGPSFMIILYVRHFTNILFIFLCSLPREFKHSNKNLSSDEAGKSIVLLVMKTRGRSTNRQGTYRSLFEHMFFLIIQ